tara:strand:+ start:3125 stop:3508 length:384 start_codon:yes stop_codon:yes gene_type:complete
MKVWKITNTARESVKIACKTASMHSKGIILQPGEFCLSEAQLTASMDAQERRGFISVDREFDNSDLKLNFVENYTQKQLENLILENKTKESNKDSMSEDLSVEEVVSNKSDFEKAAEDAEKYINNHN